MKALEIKKGLMKKSVKLILLICFIHGFVTVSFCQHRSGKIYEGCCIQHPFFILKLLIDFLRKSYIVLTINHIMIY